MGVRLMIDEAGQELGFSFTSAAESLVYRENGTWTGTRIVGSFTHIYPVYDLNVSAMRWRC